MRGLLITMIGLGGLAGGCGSVPPEPAEAPWVVSDDPCPPGTSATVPAGSSYVSGVWYDPSGASIGWATEEDSCVNLATDDLAASPAHTTPATTIGND
jgi:hypothetical protein